MWGEPTFFENWFISGCCLRANPERALHVLSDFLCSALSGLKTSLPFTQGVALGWYVAALSGLRKIVLLFVLFMHKIINICITMQ
jgi:hypothetical protein